MKNKCLSIIMCTSLCLLAVFPTAYADDRLSDEISIASVPNSSACHISPELKETIAKTNDNELISVSMQLSGDIDHDAVEALAIQRADITEAQLAAYEQTAYSLTATKNETFQRQVIMDAYDKVSAERTAILKEYYQNLVLDFLSREGLEDAKCHEISSCTPFIYGIELTKERILQLTESGSVCFIELFVNGAVTDCASVSDTMQLIGGNVAINNGYTSSGIKVGLVENGNPKTSLMGSDAANISIVGDSTATSDHATLTSGIIKQFAPGCTIYSYAANTETSVLAACRNLITSYNVHVINLSIQSYVFSGYYTSVSRELDMIAHDYKVPIVVAAGNQGDEADSGDSALTLSRLAAAPNVIAVGAVHTSGTNPDATGAFTLGCGRYVEYGTVVNKPDVCAPGQVELYGLSDHGTSFAAPHVTGTIVQMIARNAGLAGKPEILKAALVASAYRNTGTSRDYVSGTLSSNQEGAGIIDSEFCYYVAQNGRRWHFDITNTTTQTVSVYCDSTSKLFRIGAAWHANSADSTTAIIDIDIYVYKNGVFVGRSIATSSSSSRKNTNYEVIELSPEVLQQYGAGYYDVQVRVISSTVTPNPCRVGIAWEQPR